MQKLKHVVCLLVCAILAAGGLTTGLRAQSQGTAFKIPIRQEKLRNGLRVVLSEDHSAPTYSIAVAYDVGSRNERQGRTGFAHLFEHMMFEGSENVGKGEMDLLIENNGGSSNGTTNEERTIYFESMPSNQIDLGLYMEADRMRALVITQANVDNQRSAVQEERRLRVDNQPYGQLTDELPELAYDSFPYHHSVIGSMADLNAASLEDVVAFHRTYYAPNNAVLSLVGDFNSDELMVKVRKYFESIPSQPAPAPVTVQEPPQTAERRKTLTDNFAPLSRIDIAYKIPAGNTPDWYALNVLSDILSSGQSSILTQKLVRDKEAATVAAAFVGEQRGPGLFRLIAIIRPGHTPDEVEKMIAEEVERAKQQPYSNEELAKVRMLNLRNEVSGMTGTLGRALDMADDTVFYNDPTLIYTQVGKFNAVTAADVQRVAQKYLTENNRTVIVTNPKPKPADTGGSGE
ncbi:MAG TPA: pitrilysin family protein [Candidatus Acidoferrales bacterium]|jgi:predicted Zn-dependent peptidase|nr:pitrilysin family protein [Candidatus Acidoferrales bacterium]